MRAVLAALFVLWVAALMQFAVYFASGSIALLADLIHNFGDAATAIPSGIAAREPGVDRRQRAHTR